MMENYKITNKIGETDISKVYNISYDSGEKRVLKVIDYSKLNDTLKSRVFNELKIIDIINEQPNIVKYYNYEINDQTKNIFIIMEQLKDIKNYFHAKTITYKEVTKLCLDICCALETFHKNNLIHCDIKPSNIFIDNDGNFKLGDFNSVISNKSNTYYGTPAFTAPECFINQFDKRCDIYSLGLVMYTLLNGGLLPFQQSENDYEEAIRIRNSGKNIEIIEDVKEELMNIILKCIQFNPNNRYNNVEELKYDIIKCQEKNIKSNNLKKINFSFLDLTMDVKNPILKNKFAITLRNYSIKYSLKQQITIIIFILLIIILLGNYTLYLIKNKPCKDGFVNNNGICVEGYYKCEKGYTLKDKECIKTIKEEKARANYYCPKGYSLKEGYCVNDSIMHANFEYKCADGFTLKGDKCYKEESAQAPLLHSCPDNYILAGTKCITATSIDAYVSYSCSSADYILQGKNCVKKDSTITKATKSYSCPNGGVLDNTTCDIMTEPKSTVLKKCDSGTYSVIDKKCHLKYSATVTYVCNNGIHDGAGNCITDSSVSKPADEIYTCPENYIRVAEKCTKAETLDATKNYYCPTDTVLKNGMCYGTITSDALGIYTCPDGYLLSGLSCVKDDLKTPNVKYTCSRLYKLDGSKCKKYETKEPIIVLKRKEDVHE